MKKHGGGRLFSRSEVELVHTISSQGKCFPCADTECPLMGHHTDMFIVTEGISETKYFLTTGSSTPYGREYLEFHIIEKISQRFKSSLLVFFKHF